MRGRSESDCDRIADEDRSRLAPRTHQPIESEEMRDHQHGHIENRNRTCGAQLPRQRRKTALDGVVIAEQDVAATTKTQNSGRTLTVRSANMASTPVAKSP